MIFSILELVTCLKLGATARVDHEPRGHEEKKFRNHWSRVCTQSTVAEKHKQPTGAYPGVAEGALLPPPPSTQNLGYDPDLPCMVDFSPTLCTVTFLFYVAPFSCTLFCLSAIYDLYDNCRAIGVICRPCCGPVSRTTIVLLSRLQVKYRCVPAILSCIENILGMI